MSELPQVDKRTDHTHIMRHHLAPSDMQGNLLQCLIKSGLIKISKTYLHVMCVPHQYSHHIHYLSIYIPEPVFFPMV